ncbi:DUF2147 domain-containing protein [Sediminibacter sp. Hel_I_10]|uniref:DUF2147 domain-containing protein n=1 Tax=Sediminibacter sp. Hel_I_10 TaxID=1392490 RepID=UPI000478D282|nr:DUF2147 domain-containing protein [Sediminibacter sp. Hel_I_10]
MTKIAILILVQLLSFNSYAQDIVGKWKTIDDNSGIAKSIVEVYEKDGEIFGKVIEIFNEAKQDVRCIDCEGVDEDRLVLGMDIIKNMEYEDEAYRNGTITNPENGKIYDCRLKLEDDKLQVRGYVAFFYRTQYWIRVEE